MSASKDLILGAIRQNRPAGLELPSLQQEWTEYADRRQKFIEVLEGVGGRALVAHGLTDLNEQLNHLPLHSEAQKIASLVPGVATRNVDLAAINSPHALEDIDLAILPGQFCVAENAAVWVTDQQLPLRVLYFLCQHLVLVVPAGGILDHMHAAYERLDASNAAGQTVFSQPVFGAFISGPSKTADIEQSLVIGAHGPRSLTVCLLEV